MAVGITFGSLDKNQKDDVLKAIAKQALARFNIYKDTITGAFDFRKLDSEQRLEFYNTRLPETWQALASFNYDLYKKQQDDWIMLEQRRLNREVSAFNPFYFQESGKSPALIQPEGPLP